MKRTLIALAAGALLLAGCSSPDTSGTVEDSQSPSSPSSAEAGAAVTTNRAEPQTAASAAGSIYGISPAGVTTSVLAPADTTSPEYAQACADASQFIGGQGASGAEAMLRLLQSDPAAMGEDPSDGEYWADQTPEKQASVIAAIHAAANGTCP